MSALIWLHEDTLRLTHPVFRIAPPGTPAIHIWDDAYLRLQQYSLKRLVFLYETLCELNIPILAGDTQTILRQHPADHIYIPQSPNPILQSIATHLPGKQISVIADDPFVTLKKSGDFRRFFQYWSKAEHRAFLPNGGAIDAQWD